MSMLSKFNLGLQAALSVDRSERLAIRDRHSSGRHWDAAGDDMA
jgi:hypothetical protein